MQKQYINKDDLLNGIYSENPKDVMKYIAGFPIADVVSKELYEQVKYERDVLQEMVDVTERKTGKWVGIDDEPCEVWECDRCGYIMECYEDDRTNYCPNCGAKMEGEKDE